MIVTAALKPGTPDLHPEWDRLAVRVLTEYQGLIITTNLIKQAEQDATAAGRLDPAKAASVSALYRSRMVTVLYLLKYGVPVSVLESVTR